VSQPEIFITKETTQNMRTYVVESDFWERSFDRVKKCSNVQWLSLGAAFSAFVFIILVVQTSSQHSQDMEWHLSPYETKVLQLPHVMLAKQTLVLEGNISATKLYLTQKCPVQQVMEQETTEKKVDVQHRGKQQQDFQLQTGATVDFSLTAVDGDIQVHLFSDWDGEREYERHPATAIEEAIWSGMANEKEDAHFSVTADKDDTYVFLFQGVSGQHGMAHYKVSRVSYDLTHVKSTAAIDTTQDCTYEGCQVSVSNQKREQNCLVIESTSLLTRDITLQVHIHVNNHHWLVLLISLLPLVASLLYIKYGKEPAVIGRPMQAMQYELVSGE
jgi:hypothetical protein